MGGILGNPRFEEVWALVVSLQGQQFETKTGKPFTYEVRGSVVHPSRTQYNISRSDFGRVLEIGPLDGPGPISNLVRGSAYIWAILHDSRVKRVWWPEVNR
jgi:hypothetical protein